MESWEPRFWAKVRKTSRCWLWLGALRVGYGAFKLEGKVLGAHRLAYELRVGSIPEGKVLDHKCENRRCVRPQHLRPVTLWENTLRSRTNPLVLNSKATRCKRGHLFSKKNTKWVRNYGKPGKHRVCRECHCANKRWSRSRTPKPW